MKVIVCNGDSAAGEQLCRLVNKITREECCTYVRNDLELLDALESPGTFDVILMDVVWNGEEKEIRLAEQIHDLYPEIFIIYLTEYAPDYIQQIFLCPANISGVLLKPVDETLLRDNLNKISNILKSKKQKPFIFRQKNAVYSLQYDEIMYLESVAHKINIYAKRGIFSCYDKLDALAAGFPSNFCHCHKSYLVNMDEIWKLGMDHAFVMRDGQTIPISKLRYSETKKQYFQYIKKHCYSVQGGNSCSLIE